MELLIGTSRFDILILGTRDEIICRNGGAGVAGLWRGIHRDSDSPGSPDRGVDTGSHSHANRDTDSRTDRDGHVDGSPDRDTGADAHAHPDTDSCTDRDSHADALANCDAHPDPDAGALCPQYNGLSVGRPHTSPLHVPRCGSLSRLLLEYPLQRGPRPSR